MMSQRQQSADRLCNEDKKLLDQYINEYNDIFYSIIILPSCEFLDKISKRVQITLRQKFNGFSSSTKTKVETYLCDNIYSKEYKLANTIMKSLKNKEKTKNVTYFKGKIIDHHCISDQPDDIEYIHSCGEKFAIFNYTSSKNKQLFLVCLKCDQIYKSSLVKFYCKNCECDFYSKVLDSKEEKDDLPFATWKKYHCNAIINDIMKCIDCKENLLYDKEINTLICLKCNKKINPNSIIWKCVICQKEFESEVKAYNPLEFKNMKIAVKDTLLDKIKAKPEKINCGCDYDINSVKFYHKNGCKGELLLGEMNRKKIIVCQKCDALSFYDNFIWTCSKCEKKFKANEKGDVSNVKVNFIKYNSGKRVQRSSEGKNDEDKDKDKDIGNKNFGSVAPSKKISNNNINNKNVIPTPNKIPKNGVKKKESCRSPYLILKQNLAKKFAGVEIEDGIVNLGKVLAKNEDEKEQLFEKIFDKDKPQKNASSSNSISTSSHSSLQAQDDINNNSSNNNNSNSINPSTKEREINEDFEANDYKLIKQIGEGSFGKIYLVESKNGIKYALKKIVATTIKEIQSLKHEYEILLSLQKYNKSMNLINIYGIQTKKLDLTTYIMYILMDLATTDWEKEILSRAKRKIYYGEGELISIIKPLIKTFSELQKRSISHRDIKPQNILVFDDDRSFKIADFGEAKEIFGDKVTNKQTLKGTELYMSPMLFQALRNRKMNIKYIEHNTYKSDVFSFGLCCLFAATLCFEAIYDIRELNNMISLKIIVEKYLKKRYSQKILELLYVMLELNEKNRYDFIELEKYIENNI